MKIKQFLNKRENQRLSIYLLLPAKKEKCYWMYLYIHTDVYISLKCKLNFFLFILPCSSTLFGFRLLSAKIQFVEKYCIFYCYRVCEENALEYSLREAPLMQFVSSTLSLQGWRVQSAFWWLSRSVSSECARCEGERLCLLVFCVVSSLLVAGIHNECTLLSQPQFLFLFTFTDVLASTQGQIIEKTQKILKGTVI